MKLFTFAGLAFFLFSVLEVEISFCDIIIPSPNSRQIYNLLQLVQDVALNVRAHETINDIKNNFQDDDLHSNSPVSNLFDLELSHLSTNSLNKSCLSDLLYIAQNLKTKDVVNSWALEMLDSNGKPESGFLEGNLKWLGDFDECRNIHAPKKNNSNVGGFDGQYCSLELTVGNSSLIGILIGFCMPDSCHSSDLMYSYMKFLNATRKVPFLKKLGVLKPASIVCKANIRKLTNGAIATICVISVFLALALVGSLVTIVKYLTSINKPKLLSLKEGDGAINHDLEKPYQNGSDDDVLLINEGSRSKLSVFLEKSDTVLNCFCVFTNGSKILNTSATEGQYLCLHGIRFLSMSWVIVCHTYVFSFTAVRNMRGVISDIDNLPFQVILNGFFSVDSFFVLSAFLMAYLYLQESAKKKEKFPWIYFYVHRYLRLTPVYMLVLGFYTTLYTYLSSGPMWPDYDTEPLCQKYWWWNILYINNFLSATKMCMPWSWYLANDMQFFVISPIFLITFRRWPKLSYSIIALFLIGSCTSAFVISYHYNLFSCMGDLNHITSVTGFMMRWLDYFDKFYTKPYTRIGPYLVGIALGCYLFKRKSANKPKLNCIILLFGWTIALSVALSCVYGQYHKKLDLVGSSFYNSLSHTAYGASLCWVIFVCLTEHGGVVNKILSYKLFIPLSRLSYCAYLIHPIILTGYFGSLRTSFEFSHASMVVFFFGLLVITYAISFMASLLFESPIIRLEKFIRTHFNPETNKS